MNIKLLIKFEIASADHWVLAVEKVEPLRLRGIARSVNRFLGHPTEI